MIKTFGITNYKSMAGYISIVFVSLGIIGSAIGWYSNNFNIILVGILGLFLGNVFFSLQKKERLFFLLFHISFFTFILGRVCIEAVSGIRWWEEMQQAEKNVKVTLGIITISLIALMVGGLLAYYIRKVQQERKPKNSSEVHSEKKADFIIYLQNFALVLFIVTMCFFLLQELEKVVYMCDRSYLDYYTGFHSRLPGLFHTIASFMTYSLCIFLSTFPTKRRAIIPLVLYEMSAVPSLIIGVRNPFVLNSIFIFTYYCIREFKSDKDKWFGKAEKLLSVVAVPAGIVFMAMYAYIRKGINVKSLNPFSLIKEFFVGQGVTFNVISIGYGWRNGLPQRADRNYTFGTAIDYLVHGRLGQLLFGTEALPDGNNIINGVESNSLAHNLSYVTLKDSYLAGNGWGTSYLIENYLDFGYVGVAIFSLILGIILVYSFYWFGKRTLVNTIILVSLTSIFFLPRAESLGWLTFIVTLQFWACILGCFGGACILRHIVKCKDRFINARE